MKMTPEQERVWDLIKGARSAVLVTAAPDGGLQSRPMGCLQRQFDGVLWFMTFGDSAKVAEIATNDRVLVSYADHRKHEYVSVGGRARLINDRERAKELWTEGLRPWFPEGPDAPEITLIAVKVDAATYWTNAASVVTYGWAYIRARLSGRRAKSEEIVEIKKIPF